jgi:hypothetical protein
MLSVISTSSRSGARPVVASARRIVSCSAPRWNWTGETLTAIRIWSGQRAACAQASRITQAPIGTIRPVSSAIGMKSTGETRPRLGWFQRISASNEQMRLCSRSNRGW